MPRAAEAISAATAQVGGDVLSLHAIGILSLGYHDGGQGAQDGRGNGSYRPKYLLHLYFPVYRLWRFSRRFDSSIMPS